MAARPSPYLSASRCDPLIQQSEESPTPSPKSPTIDLHSAQIGFPYEGSTTVAVAAPRWVNHHGRNPVVSHNAHAKAAGRMIVGTDGN